MTFEEEQLLQAWRIWLMEAVIRKFDGRKITAQLLEEARSYLLELIELTFDGDPSFKDWKKRLDVETGMDEETEKPYYRIVWREESNYDN